MRRIIFTGAGGAAAESIFGQWHDRYDLFFGDANPAAISPRIPRERRLKLPFAAEDGFVDQLFRLARDLSCDVIVPGVDEELILLSSKAKYSPAPILLPALDFVEVMLDKLRAAHAIQAAGLAVPRTIKFGDAEELNFPIIVKPRSGRGSRGVHQLAAPSQLSAYLALGGNPDPSAFIAQDLVRGQEYTVFVAADRAGRLAAIVPVKVLVKRGITIRAETEATPEIIDYATRFQQHFRAAGIYNIQLMLTADRQVLPFEVNPRISTTFCLAIATGFDPVAAFLDGQLGPVFLPGRQWSLQRSWHNNIQVL